MESVSGDPTDGAARGEGAALLAELERYHPADARERRMVDELRIFLRAQPRAFERGLALGHVTASAWVVDRGGTRAVLTHHRALGRWLQLGGHADGDADVRRVALREAREESGIEELEFAQPEIYDVDVHRIPARGNQPAHLHFDVRFAFYAPDAAEPRASDESYAVAWMDLDELERYGADESVRRLAAKTGALTGSRKP